jgi:glycosyltransferase involved in cell wall biosynthesis
MKTFVLVSGDFNTHGGMDCANYHLARHLANLPDTAVHIVAYDVESPLAEHPNVTWHRVSKLMNSYMLSEGRLDRAGRAVAKRFPGARVIVNGGNCTWGDVNWVHYVHAAWEPQAAGGILLRARRALQHRRHLRAERGAIRQAKLVIANSDRTRRDLIEHMGVEPSRIATVYYGIDASRFTPATPEQRNARRRELGIEKNAPALAFIGALGDRRKGFDLLFDAWRLLTSPGTWDAKLLVIGQGAELAQWQARASSRGFSDSIRFLGFRRDVPKILQACDALVSPTRYEAYGLGVHEAICCGIPALVSASAGVAERYPSELSPLLIPGPLTPESVAQRLRLWRERMREFSGAVAGFSEQLREISWDAMAQEIVHSLSAVLRGEGGGEGQESRLDEQRNSPNNASNPPPQPSPRRTGERERAARA